MLILLLSITTTIHGEPAALRQSHLHGALSDGIRFINRVVAGDLARTTTSSGVPSLWPWVHNLSKTLQSVDSAERLFPAFYSPNSTPRTRVGEKTPSSAHSMWEQKRRRFLIRLKSVYLQRSRVAYSTVFQRNPGLSALGRRGTRGSCSTILLSDPLLCLCVALLECDKGPP